jgi:hypothetical protein
MAERVPLRWSRITAMPPWKFAGGHHSAGENPGHIAVHLWSNQVCEAGNFLGIDLL